MASSSELIMKIFNVRERFATNSSSSHSIIFLKGGASDDEANGDFGWNFFTAASQEAKSLYLAALLNSNLHGLVPDEAKKEIISSWLSPGVYPEAEGAYVDHQSVIVFPMQWDEKMLHKEFFDYFTAFMMRDDVVVLGGNDNTDEKHPLAGLGKEVEMDLPLECGREGLVARRDTRGNFWTVFNRNSGTKVRFALDKEVQFPTKSEAPELADIKITDYCPFGCAFCYQGSTAKGAHAELSTIKNLAKKLGELQCFEVALGGGEPTMHPDFEKILAIFRKNHIIPNFTTRTLNWMTQPNAESILKKCGAFAFSVQSAKDVTDLSTALQASKHLTKGIAQYVMGSTDLAEFERILEETHSKNISITLLGYKTTGRGSEFKPHDYSGWLATVRKVYNKPWMKLGIDTALAEEYEKQLKTNHVSNITYSTKEGKFSMYVDAVANKVGPSSFCNQLEMRKLDLAKMSSSSLQEKFSAF